jgi:hypothetical protein
VLVVHWLSVESVRRCYCCQTKKLPPWAKGPLVLLLLVLVWNYRQRKKHLLVLVLLPVELE